MGRHRRQLKMFSFSKHTFQVLRVLISWLIGKVGFVSIHWTSLVWMKSLSEAAFQLYKSKDSFPLSQVPQSRSTTTFRGSEGQEVTTKMRGHERDGIHESRGKKGDWVHRGKEKIRIGKNKTHFNFPLLRTQYSRPSFQRSGVISWFPRHQVNYTQRTIHKDYTQRTDDWLKTTQGPCCGRRERPIVWGKRINAFAWLQFLLSSS